MLSTAKDSFSLGNTLEVSYTITEDTPGINMVSTAKKYIN
ncbi:hypothetical protein HMPREF9446_00070 [Bacteroides fluxus YIT 12057]|uniref:Uncharacterized protein n=1 Tax=Bacteroides fluxus YIT 12057 TaxID=763034 RepID=F3PMY4_9BACE|nr:hypothetical protein HMPREF9446_00070 [Bacteroides fluxus YIT 12057]